MICKYRSLLVLKRQTWIHTRSFLFFADLIILVDQSGWKISSKNNAWVYKQGKVNCSVYFLLEHNKLCVRVSFIARRILNNNKPPNQLHKNKLFAVLTWIHSFYITICVFFIEKRKTELSGSGKKSVPAFRSRACARRFRHYFKSHFKSAVLLFPHKIYIISRN